MQLTDILNNHVSNCYVYNFSRSLFVLLFAWTPGLPCIQPLTSLVMPYDIISCMLGWSKAKTPYTRCLCAYIIYRKCVLGWVHNLSITNTFFQIMPRYFPTESYSLALVRDAFPRARRWGRRCGVRDDPGGEVRGRHAGVHHRAEVHKVAQTGEQEQEEIIRLLPAKF